MALDLATIEAARERLRGALSETPCTFSQTLSEATWPAVLPQARKPPHDRVGETEAELTLETSGRPHVESVIERLRTAGYRAEELR